MLGGCSEGMTIEGRKVRNTKADPVVILYVKRTPLLDLSVGPFGALVALSGLCPPSLPFSSQLSVFRSLALFLSVLF